MKKRKRVRYFAGRPYRLKSRHRKKAAATKVATRHRAKGPKHRARVVKEAKGYAVYGNPCGGVSGSLARVKGIKDNERRKKAVRAWYARNAAASSPAVREALRQEKYSPRESRARKLKAVNLKASRAKRKGGRAPF